MSKIPLGLNLGLIYGEYNENPVESLKKISKIGYKGVEVADTVPLPINNFNELLHDLDLVATSIHTNTDRVDKDIEGLIDFSHSIHCNYIILPWYNPDLLKSIDDFKSLAKFMNAKGAKCKEQGIQLCYHHHHFEFIKFDREYGMDIFLKNTDPELVKLEFDTYWLTFIGEKPAEYIAKYEDRCCLLHLKDMKDDEKHSFTEAGSGIIDFKQICNDINPKYIRWLITEQDSTDKNVMESIGISFENLKKLGIC